MDSNVDQGVCYLQPKTLEQRVAIANDFAQRFHYPVPMLVDDMANSADAVYAGWPERLYVIDDDGTIAYKGPLGPDGFDPEAVEAWLEQRFPDAPHPPPPTSDAG